MGPQRTLTCPAELRGYGVHSGLPCTLRLLPAPIQSGIMFVRTDLPGAPEIPARLDHIVPDALLRRTTLEQGAARVYTIEHILSAAAGLSITNLRIEMDAAEPPFLDGSALPFVEAMLAAGIQDQDAEAPELVIERPLAFCDGDAEVTATPDRDLRVTYFFTSDEPLLRTQSATFIIDPGIYAREIAPARTFCFFHEIEQLRAARLIAGGNLSSAVVIGRKSILNDHLRFADEPVRHKILDFIGDLALLGLGLRGHFTAWRAGHRVNAAFAKHLRKEFNI